MTYSLDAMLNSITGYNDIMEEFGFEFIDGGGIKPWSILFVNSETKFRIDVRANDWTLYNSEGEEIAVGTKPIELKEHFLIDKTRDELIEMLLKK